MGGLVLAWLVGEGIIVYRSVKVNKVPPGPGQLLFSSGVFVLLALMGEAPSARPLATTLAWGFDIAAFMNVAGTKIKPVPNKNWPPGQASPMLVFPDGHGALAGKSIKSGVDQTLQGATPLLFGSTAGNAAQQGAGILGGQ